MYSLISRDAISRYVSDSFLAQVKNGWKLKTANEELNSKVIQKFRFLCQVNMTLPTHFVFKLEDHNLCPESVTDTVSESIRKSKIHSERL